MNDENEKWSLVADAEVREWCEWEREEAARTPEQKLADAWDDALDEAEYRREVEELQAACSHEEVCLWSWSFRKGKYPKVTLQCAWCGKHLRGSWQLFRRYRGRATPSSARLRMSRRGWCHE